MSDQERIYWAGIDDPFSAIGVGTAGRCTIYQRGAPCYDSVLARVHAGAQMMNGGSSAGRRGTQNLDTGTGTGHNPQN